MISVFTGYSNISMYDNMKDDVLKAVHPQVCFFFSDLEDVPRWTLHHIVNGSLLPVHWRHLQRLLLQVYQSVWLVMAAQQQVCMS